MDSDLPIFESGETADFGNRVRNLTDKDRREYETACDRLAERLQHAEVSLPVLLSAVDAEQPVRQLILIHLGKLWLESERNHGRKPDPSAFLDQAPELHQVGSARSELEAWASLLAEAGSQATPSLLEFHGRTFHLPDEYELLHRLQDDPARMSLVLLVQNKRLKRKEVLKAFNPVRLGDARAVRRFLDEPEKASQTQHPAIIRVWHASQANLPCPYYTMEYLEGGSLADLLKVGPMASLQAARYLAIVARALHHVHATLGIAHGDIKAENILLDKEGNPKLTDFGLSRSIVPDEGESARDGRVSMEISGTLGYVAPEQLDEKFRPAGYDRNQSRIATDLFALGATLYFCLTRHLPYQHGSRRPSLFAVIANELVPVQQLNPAVDNKLDAITQKCLQKHPEHRFRTAAELADALEAWLSHQTLKDVLDEDTTFPADQKNAPPLLEQIPRQWPWALLTSVVILALAVVLRSYSNDSGTVASSNEQQVKGTQESSPPATDVTRAAGEQPPPAASLAPVEVLCQRGWDREPAEAVLELNGPWLTTVRGVSPTDADNQVDLLSRLGVSGISLDFCRRSPHRAAMLATVSGRDDHRTLANVLKTDDAILADRLFSLYASAGETQSLVHLFREEAELLRELGDRGWLGCEAALLRPGETETDRVYNGWLQRIVKERLVPAQTDEARKRAAEFQAYAMIHGPALKVRLTNDPQFRERFLPEIWPAFLTLLDKGVFTLPDVFQIDALWVYLAREGEKGKSSWKIISSRRSRSCMVRTPTISRACTTGSSSSSSQGTRALSVRSSSQVFAAGPRSARSSRKNCRWSSSQSPSIRRERTPRSSMTIPNVLKSSSSASSSLSGTPTPKTRSRGGASTSLFRSSS